MFVVAAAGRTLNGNQLMMFQFCNQFPLQIILVFIFLRRYGAVSVLAN